MQLIIDLQKDLEKVLVSKFDEVQARGMFRRSSKTYDFMMAVYKSLNLKESMTIQEVENTIRLIEKLPLSSGEYTYLNQLISEYNRVLSQINNEIYDFPKVNLPPGSLALPGRVDLPNRFTRLLIKTHQALLNHYELRTTYSKEMLELSQAFHGLSITTREAALPDQSLLVTDIGRGIHFFEIDGQSIEPSGEPLDFLEKFAEDVAADVGSKANKLLNFGGQFLLAVVGGEFLNTIEFANGKVGNLTPMDMKGRIIFSKDSRDSTIDIRVNLNINSFVNEFDAYYISSDNPTKLAAPSSMPEVAERVSLSPESIAPVCQFNVKIKLILEEESNQYFFCVNQCRLRINTSELISATLDQENEDDLQACATAVLHSSLEVRNGHF